MQLALSKHNHNSTDAPTMVASMFTDQSKYHMDDGDQSVEDDDSDMNDEDDCDDADTMNQCGWKLITQ